MNTNEIDFPKVSPSLQRIDRTIQGEVQSFVYRINNKKVESVYFPPRANDMVEEHGVCVSVSAGCFLSKTNKACIMCATGTSLSFDGNLKGKDITGIVDDILKEVNADSQSQLRINFAGEGEPLLNTSAVIESIGEIQRRYGVRRTHFFISTVGISKIIPNFAEELVNKIDPRNVYLQFSMHALNDQLRRTFIPISQLPNNNLENIGYACRRFCEVLYKDNRVINNPDELYKTRLRINFLPLKYKEKYNFDENTLAQDMRNIGNWFPIEHSEFQIAKWNHVNTVEPISSVYDNPIVETILNEAKNVGFQRVKFFRSRGSDDKTGACGTLVAKIKS